MKKLLIGLFLIPAICKAQDSLLYHVFPLKDGIITYEKIIEIPGVSKDDLYNRAKSWALPFYSSQKDALQTDDKEAGLLAYKGFFSQIFFPPRVMGVKVEYDNREYWEIVKILVKDGKAKIVVSNIHVEVDSKGGFPFTIENFETSLNKNV
jgi:hypothetical protein